MRIQRVKILILLLLLFCLTACKKQTPIQNYLDLGEKYLNDMNYENAIVAFTKVIDMDSQNIEAYIGIAKAYERLEDYKNAIKVLENAINNIADKEQKLLLEGILDKYKKILSQQEKTDYTKTEQKTVETVLLSDEKELLNMIYHGIEDEKYEEIGYLIIEYKNELDHIIENRLKGNKQLYTEDGFSEEIEGTGMVLQGADTIFLGKFYKGKPEGEVKVIYATTNDDDDDEKIIWINYGVIEWQNGEPHDTCKLHSYTEIKGEEWWIDRDVQIGNLYQTKSSVGKELYVFTGDVSWMMESMEVNRNERMFGNFNYIAKDGIVQLDRYWISENFNGKEAYTLRANSGDDGTGELPEFSIGKENFETCAWLFSYPFVWLDDDISEPY